MTGRSDGRGEAGYLGGSLHAAVVYDSDDSLRTRVAPFLEAGIDRKETILAVVPAGVQQTLRSVLGGHADQVQWREPSLAHRGLGEVFEEFRSFLADQDAATAPARLLTENDLDGEDDPGRLAAYLRFEAASTEVFRPYGHPWVCLYDRRRHPAELLDHVGEVHPQLLTDRVRPLPSTVYFEPADYLSSHAGPLSPVPDLVGLDRDFAVAAELRSVRQQLGGYAASVDQEADAVERIIAAAHEVISNAVRHGQPPCRLRAWQSDGVFRVRIDDHGPGGNVATAGYRRPATAVGRGMGLWVARQFADVIQIQASATTGTAVELQFR
jgi:anti-sigma regulatory factor (Ser/Thr protein kinase)